VPWAVGRLDVVTHDEAVPVAKVDFGAQKRAVRSCTASLLQRGGQPVGQPRLGKGAHERHGFDRAAPEAVDGAHRHGVLATQQAGDAPGNVMWQVVHGPFFFFTSADFFFYFLNA